MIYDFPARVRFSEIDGKGDLTLHALVNYLQDCATFHAQAVGYGVDWTVPNKKAWVVASLQMAVHRIPHFNEEIVTTTWAQSFRGMIGVRDFTVCTPEGDRLVSASSDWVFMDMAKGAPERVSREHADAYGIHPERTLDEDFGGRKVKLPQEMEEQETFPVEMQHLDVNGHVNNGQFISMAQRYLPEGFALRRFRAEYKKQAHLGDRIRPFVKTEEDRFYISLADGERDPYFVCEAME